MSAYLRLIVVRDESLAARIASEARGSGDGRFAALAEQHSIDPMASDGGYLGEVKLADLRPELLAAAQRLQYGEVSPVLPMSGGGTFAILARLPRDFRYRAGALQKEADKLRSSGSLSEAMEKSRAALRTYPAFLRALFFLAAGEEQSQNAGESARLLRKAAEFYPEDATAQFNLGVSYASAGRAEQAVSAYKRAIELTPDYPAAYLNLGAALFSLGRVDEAIEAFRAGLRAAPLSAPLYYSLGVALRQSGDEVAAKNALALATAIDREFVLSRDPLPAR